MKKTTVLIICGLVIALSLPAMLWAFSQQKMIDDGNDIVVFNNREVPTAAEIDGESKSLAPQQTWRHRVGDGEHVVVIDGEPRSISLGWDRADVVVAVDPVPMAGVDFAGDYVRLMAGKMAGRNGIESVHPASPYIVFDDRWVLSPYEQMPDSVSGQVPLKLFILPHEVATTDDARQLLAPKRAPVEER